MKTINREQTNFDYYRKEVLKEFQNCKESSEKELYALKSIKRAKKKDWSDFQSFLKNFSCPDDVRMYYDDGYWSKAIKIWYAGESISIDRDTHDEKIVEEIRKTNPERIISSSYYKDSVEFTPDEFMGQIQKWIDYREKVIKEYTESIENFESICDGLWEKIRGVCEYISSINSNAYQFKNLAWDTLKHFYHYE